MNKHFFALALLAGLAADAPAQQKPKDAPKDPAAIVAHIKSEAREIGESLERDVVGPFQELDQWMAQQGYNAALGPVSLNAVVGTIKDFRQRRLMGMSGRMEALVRESQQVVEAAKQATSCGDGSAPTSSLSGGELSGAVDDYVAGAGTLGMPAAKLAFDYNVFAKDFDTVVKGFSGEKDNLERAVRSISEGAAIVERNLVVAQKMADPYCLAGHCEEVKVVCRGNAAAPEPKRS